MATSTFDSHFAVERKHSAAFVEEMSKSVPPTLNKGFNSNFTHLTQDKELKERLLRSLRK